MNSSRDYSASESTADPTPRISDDLRVAASSAHEAGDRLENLLRRLRGARPEPVPTESDPNVKSVIAPSMLQRADDVRSRLASINAKLDEIEKLV